MVFWARRRRKFRTMVFAWDFDQKVYQSRIFYHKDRVFRQKNGFFLEGWRFPTLGSEKHWSLLTRVRSKTSIPSIIWSSAQYQNVTTKKLILRLVCSFVGIVLFGWFWQIDEWWLMAWILWYTFIIISEIRMIDSLGHDSSILIEPEFCAPVQRLRYSKCHQINWKHSSRCASPSKPSNTLYARL